MSIPRCLRPGSHVLVLSLFDFNGHEVAPLSTSPNEGPLTRSTNVPRNQSRLVAFFLAPAAVAGAGQRAVLPAGLGHRRSAQQHFAGLLSTAAAWLKKFDSGYQKKHIYSHPLEDGIGGGVSLLLGMGGPPTPCDLSPIDLLETNVLFRC